MIMSADPLKPLESSNCNMEIDLPNIYPLHHTISLDQTNFYKTEDIYRKFSCYCYIQYIHYSHNVTSILYSTAVSATTPWKNVHTIFVHYDPEQVKNLTGLTVTESQIFGRTMIKAYTMAAFCARQKFGSSVKKLPEPVTLQCIQSDGKNYHFFIFQLNSLDANDVNVKNFWYALSPLTLYKKAKYYNARPIVTGYNPEVFRRILAFYRNDN